ncbi:MAG TPA: GreA/GreB family elongation factor [Kofleriaceae bacterium]|nr:GreA/GreB family elongation factor [Kofleriaceae bacterium]
MSKAFTKEDDDAPPVAVRRRRVPVPEGVPNYLTAAGARVLREELSALSAAPNRESDADVRIQELSEHLASAEVVEPAVADRARFGSTVELDDGTRYQIVGVLEADPQAGKLSWLSPLAKRLLGARVGDTIDLPRGVAEVVRID